MAAAGFAWEPPGPTTLLLDSVDGRDKQEPFHLIQVQSFLGPGTQQLTACDVNRFRQKLRQFQTNTISNIWQHS